MVEGGARVGTVCVRAVLELLRLLSGHDMSPEPPFLLRRASDGVQSADFCFGAPHVSFLTHGTYFDSPHLFLIFWLALTVAGAAYRPR